ncbi:MAG: hypothetical protein JNK87_07565 [Bryobacterales bacterium]|nr:hypothetical protein [Bryobacterales bacterium]
MVRLATLVLSLAAFAFAQDAAPEVRYSALGIPCEPGEAPFGSAIPVQCPAIEEQGIMVFVKATDSATAGFQITVKYTDANGEAKESVQTVGRTPDVEWTSVVFKIGRLKTEKLSGNTVNEVTAVVAPAP